MTALPVTDPEEALAIHQWAAMWRQGMSTAEIARRLGLGEHQVYARIGRIKELARKLSNASGLAGPRAIGSEDSITDLEALCRVPQAPRSGG